jgi:hypothetical protein
VYLSINDLLCVTGAGVKGPRTHFHEERAMPSIRDYLIAGYPLLHVSTTEYEQATKQIIDDYGGLSGVDTQDLYGVWKITTGLVVKYLDNSEIVTTIGDDLLQALEYVRKSERQILAIFHNVREFVPSSIIFQGLIDATLQAEESGSTIVLLGPDFQIPPELQSLITRVDFPLPDKDALFQIFSDLAIEHADVIVNKKGEKWSASMVTSDGVPQLSKLQKKALTLAANSAAGLDTMGAKNAFCLSIINKRLNLNALRQQKEDEIRKSDVLEFIHSDDGIKDIGGFDLLKEWIKKRAKVFSEEARDYGLPYPKGILLTGHPGTGKSLAAKAIANYLRLPLIRLDMGRVFRSLVGQSEETIRKALQIAEAVSPCVCWLDM